MALWPKSGEHKQLDRYWRRVGGTLYTEVCVGREYWGREWWNGAAAERRFDGVILHGDGLEGPLGHGRFKADARAFAGRSVELVEVKRGLGEAFVGQALVGRWMFDQQVAGPYRLHVARTVVLHRHQDPARVWVSRQLDLEPVRDEPAPTRNTPMQDRTHYTLRDDRLRRVAAYRKAYGGLWFTRLPLGGPDCGIEEWGATATTWIPFVRVVNRTGDDVRVFEPAHRDLILDRENRLELVVGARERLGRGALGVAASHALMFERQYGKAFESCRIVCSKTDPAVEAACEALGRTRGIPPVGVYATGDDTR